MPNLDEILQDKEKAIQAELEAKSHRLQKEIPRAKESRPWSFHLPETDFADETTAAQRSAEDFIEFVVQKRKSVAMTLLGILTVASVVAWLIPSYYASSIQIYTPDKTRSVSSQPNLFNNRLEFASFPVEDRMPISLLARRLSSEDSKKWVIKTFFERGLDKTLSTPLDINSVSVETSYAALNEILVIDGFANSPEAASIVTKLYWESLLVEQEKFDKEQHDRVRAWFEGAQNKVTDQITTIMKDIDRMAKVTARVDHGIQMGNTYGHGFAQTELRQAELSQIKEELLAARGREADELTGVNDQDIQNLLHIRRELMQSYSGDDYDKRITDIEGQIPSLIENKLAQVEMDLNSLSGSARTIEGRLRKSESDNSQLMLVSEQQRLMQQQLDILKRQQTDLLRFSSQLELEAVADNGFKILRLPVPSANSRRPMPVVKYSLGTFVSFVMTFAIWGLLFLATRSRRKTSFA